MNTYPISCYHSISVVNELEMIFMKTSYVNINVFFVDKRCTFLLLKGKLVNNIVGHRNYGRHTARQPQSRRSVVAMKRDFDLVRKLLQYFEARESSAVDEYPDVAGFNRETVGYHCRLLYDARLLRCEPVKSSTSDRVIRVLPFELTWDGHEFLDKIRSDTAWNKIKTHASEKGLALSFSVVTELAKRLLTQALSGL